jgi:hypothetical protein
MAAECGRGDVRLQTPPATEAQQPPDGEAIFDYEPILGNRKGGLMTEKRQVRRRSKKEVEELWAAAGLKRMSGEDRKSGAWTLTFVADKPAPNNNDSEPPPSE